MDVQTLDVISVNIWNILISLCNLILIFFIVKRFLFKPVSRVLAEREQAVNKVYSDAEALRAEADERKREYEKKLSAAEDEAGSIIRSANERANKAGSELIAEANRKAAAILKKADEDIAFEKKKAVNEIKDEISGLSLDIAEKMIGRELREEDHRALIDGFIDGIGQ